MKVAWYHPQGQEQNYNRLMASVWIRCLQLLPYLQASGIECSVNDHNTQTEIAVFVRWQDETAYQLASRLKAQGTHVVFDLCVNYFDETDVLYVGRPVTERHRADTLRMLSVAEVVTCASAFIAQRAGEFHPWVEYISDSIDQRHFSFVKPTHDFYMPKLRAIWSGVTSKARELEFILPLLKQFGIELTIISDKRPNLTLSKRPWARRFPYHFSTWRYEAFPKDILDGEVCIAPRLVDNPYNRGHSLFKIGVFMAQGVPAVASPVPSYGEVLKENFEGAICTSTEDWKLVLEKIHKDREMLIRWSQEARLAMEPYSTENVAGKYIHLFDRILG